MPVKFGPRLIAELYPWLLRDRPRPPKPQGWFPATRRMLWTTLRMFLGCRNETDFIAAFEVLKQCADDAVDTLLVPCGPQSTLFKWSQRLVSTTCELTIVYFPW